MKPRSLIFKYLIPMALIISLFHPPPLGASHLTSTNVPEAMSDIFSEPDFHSIMAHLGTTVKNAQEQCYYGRNEILYKLDKLRLEKPELFEKLDYGPVTKDGVMFGHVGVALYYKRKDLTQPYEEALKGSVVIDYTNYWTNITGTYRVRSWDAWRWYDFAGKGIIDYDGKSESTKAASADKNAFKYFYWNKDGPIYITNPIKPNPNKPDPNEPDPNEPSHTTEPQFFKKIEVRVVNSYDPNEKAGASGVGKARYITGEEPLRYTIFFENLKTATAPAHQVFIKDYLDITNLDLSTLYLGSISVGDKDINIPFGRSTFSDIIDLRPKRDILLKIEAFLDTGTGLLKWHFKSIDPYTGIPPEDPFAGFLPPNITPPEGEGKVTFIVMPKGGIPSETIIRNKATIVFDSNSPIETNEWVNTIDKIKPQSQVKSLASPQSGTSFLVEWAGDDLGSSGLKDYSIYVSDDGATYKLWLRSTSSTSAIFTGEAGKTYWFYSVARDQVGNLEDPPQSPDTSITIVPLIRISGGAFFFPENPTFRARFSMGVKGPVSPSGWFKYYYTRTRMKFVSTGITSVSVSGNTASISGTGTVNRVGGYTFTATVTNGSPDAFAIVIRRSDGSTYYSAGPRNISGGDLVIQQFHIKSVR